MTWNKVVGAFIEPASVRDELGGLRSAERIAILNELGRAGWELVAVREDDETFEFYLKRGHDNTT